MGALLAVSLVRAEGSGRDAVVRVALVALVALLAVLVFGWASLVPVPLALAGGVYAVQLAIDDAAVDVVAPVFAAGLLVAAELAYWSIDERERVTGEPGDGLRRLALVAGLGALALVVSVVLLAVADTIRARGLGVDVAGAAAAALALLSVVALTRSGDSTSG